MAVDDLPGPVVKLLNVIGVPWPSVNEDQVSHFATITRQFGQSLQHTHDAATGVVAKLTEAHQGASTQVMKSGWDKLTSQHVDGLISGCHALAEALDTAAGFIVAQKGIAIGTLVGMAAAFVADQAAAVVTLGLSEAAIPAIIEGAERIVKKLVQDLEQHIEEQVVQAAAQPLFNKVEEALKGLDWSQAGVSAEPSSGLSIDPQAVQQHTAVLREHANTIASHAENFQQQLEGLDF